MAALTPAFFDTSVLVAGLMEMGETSEYPQKIMTGIAGGQIRRSLTAWHCCLEFYSVATRLPEEFRLVLATIPRRNSLRRKGRCNRIADLPYNRVFSRRSLNGL
jgi:hypothetical protein